MMNWEDKLKSQERRALPPTWKDEMIRNALGEPSTVSEDVGILTWLFPQWLRIGCAAAWCVVASLYWSKPSGGRGVSEASPLVLESFSTEGGFTKAWLVSAHQLAVELHGLEVGDDSE